MTIIKKIRIISFILLTCVYQFSKAGLVYSCSQVFIESILSKPQVTERILGSIKDSNGKVVFTNDEYVIMKVSLKNEFKRLESEGFMLGQHVNDYPEIADYLVPGDPINLDIIFKKLDSCNQSELQTAYMRLAINFEFKRLESEGFMLGQHVNEYPEIADYLVPGDPINLEIISHEVSLLNTQQLEATYKLLFQKK